MNPQTPELYEQIKIHKENKPIKLIITFINTPSEKLRKWLTKVIKNITKY